VAAEDEDFDVEGWNRRLADTPSGPIGPPRVRTRHIDRPRHPSELPLDDEATDLDPFAWELEQAEAEVEAQVGVEGFPAFEHNQWTVEGEIERFGAFGRGAARARGWRRGVAMLLLALILLPLLLEAVQLAGRILQ
jgi:hypothetical protein